MTKLERSLGLLEVTLMSIGIILGAGIYVVIGEAAGLSGNGIWLSFIIASIVALLTGLSYAELSSRYPDAGAEYTYVEKAFGKKLAWLTGWFIIAGAVIGGATVSIGFGNYFNALFQTPVMLTSFAVLVVSAIILIAGVKETASVTIIITLVEAAGLITIIFIGIPELGSVDYLELAKGMKGVMEAGVLIFFSYIGFETITRLAEETKNPKRNIPKAIILSIVVTTVIYLLVGIAAVSAVPYSELAESNAPLSYIAGEVLGGEIFIVLSLIALFSTFNTVLVMLLGASRIVYSMAEEKALPGIFEKVSEITRTPWTACIGVVAGSMIFLLLGKLSTVANLTNLTVFAVFILVNISVIRLRYKKPVKKGFKTPISIGRLPILPVLGIITCFLMLINLSVFVLALGVILTLLGFLIIHIKDKIES
ncbi:MAG: amino acid permease [Candidatus Thermoplasmatota archaeon]